MTTPFSKLAGVRFFPLTAEEIVRYSVCEVKKPVPQGADEKNKKVSSKEDTPYDPRMGVLENNGICTTCLKKNIDCPGHFGHIVLPVAFYNKLFFKLIVALLNCICPVCYHVRLSKDFCAMKKLLVKDPAIRIKKIATECTKISKLNDKCKLVPCMNKDCDTFQQQKQIPLFYLNKDDIVEYYGDKKKNTMIFPAQSAYNIFRMVSTEDIELLGYNIDIPTDPKFTIDGKNILGFRPEALIWLVLPVCPPRVRPYVIRDGRVHDDDITEKYNLIIKCCNKLSTNQNVYKRNKKALTETERMNTIKDLQRHIWSLMDNKDEKSKLSSGGRASKGIKERLEKKQGRFQSNIAGKRVDYSARSVIVGAGPDLEDDQLGVPNLIADTQSIPYKVVEWNRDTLQQMVYDGQITRIFRKTQYEGYKPNRIEYFKDKTIYIGDKVEVKLQNDDPIIFNRQPTLRKESMAAFRVKRIEDKAFRLPLCWTRMYNADYDGDEMNMHVPRLIGARVEAMILMNAANVIATEQTNSCICGLVQDGLVGSYLLTNTWESEPFDTMVEVSVFMNIVTSLDIPIETYNNMLQRAYQYYPKYIRKSKNSYTLDKEGTIPGKLAVSVLFLRSFGYEKNTETNPKYPLVKIENGVMLPDSGPLCKKIVGGQGGSIIHILYEEYSPQVALRFMMQAQKMMDLWLHTHGFSFGIRDCLITEKAKVKEIVANIYARVTTIIANNSNITEELENEISEIVNSGMNDASKIVDKSMHGNDRNSLNIMRKSGAKGGIINLVQIGAFVGQQNINRQRTPFTISTGTRTLYHFDRNDYSALSRGFCEHNYLEGLTPIENWHHAGSGRIGIIATALKTGETGYIQKKIARKIEDCRAYIDGTIRDARGNIITYLFGNDAFNPKQLYHAKGINIPFFIDVHNIARTLNTEAIQNNEVGPKDKPRNILDEEIELIFEYIIIKPITTITITATQRIQRYLKAQLEKIKIYEIKLPLLCQKIRDKFEKSRVAYGEMVGAIATNCIGEPTTQLTLNVFHSAGVKEKDVSAGVPRLNELFNLTKSHKQNKSICTVYIDHPVIIECSQRSDRDGALLLLQGMIRDFQDMTVGSYLKSECMRYIPSDTSPDKIACPIKFQYNTYEKYSREWWVDMYDSLFDNNESPIEPNFWVVTLEFDMEKLYIFKQSIMHISKIIEESSPEKYRCIPSPNAIGKIDVYINFESIDEYLTEKKKKVLLPRDLSDTHTANFTVCRYVILDDIKSIQVSGISGIKKAVPREEKTRDTSSPTSPSASVWVFDLYLEKDKFTERHAVQRFIEILNKPCIIPSKTKIDDIWCVYAVYGIEAARKFLMEEITRIISFDGTYVNPRHIEILVDTMTRTGIPTSVRSNGIARYAGPIAKIMFETSVDNAITSASYGETDDMKSVASAVMFGFNSKAGTGSVEIVELDKRVVKPVKINPDITSRLKMVDVRKRVGRSKK